MSTPEKDAEIIVGKDGAEGYKNAEQREAFEESNPEYAAYSSLKFKVDDDDDDEASEPTKALGAVSSTLKGAGEEITRLRKQAEDHDLATGVDDLLDQTEQVAETLDWEQQEEFKREWQAQALIHASAIEDDDLRQRTLANLEERVDADLYEEFATRWQDAYIAQTQQDIRSALEREHAEAEAQAKSFEAVVQLETDLLNQLSPLEQACAVKLLDAARDDIASAHPGAAQEMIRLRMEMARDAAQKIEQATVQEQIVKAHGRTKERFSGRDVQAMSLLSLGLLPSLEPTTEEIHAANARATKGVKIDREKGKRIHKGTGLTGMEKLQAQQIALSKKLGVPVHDAATGRRIG